MIKKIKKNYKKMDYIILISKNKTDDNSDKKPLTPSGIVSFIFAFIVVQLYFISPIYFIFKYNRRYIEKKHIPFLQIFLNLLNCSTYVVIAIKGDGDFQNLITNSIGVVICLIVVLQLWLSMSKKKNNQYIFNFVFIFNIIFQIYYFFFKYCPKSGKYITIIINIFMYLSLNIGTYYAFRENKPDRIPILSAILGLLSSIGWTLYSVCLKNNDENDKIDKITFFSNFFSMLVLISTIVCYIYLIKFESPIKNNTINVENENEKDIKNDQEKSTKLENRFEDEENQNNDD